MSIRKVNLDIDNIIEQYLNGVSIKQLAKSNGVSRQVIYKRLRDNGIKIRNRSEAMYVRMSNTSPEKRKQLVKKANESRRGKPATEQELANKARAYQKSLHKVGEYEKQVFDFLSNLGYNAIQQQAFKKYNFDIGVGNIAVEVHQCTCNPITMPYTLNRIVDITHDGINAFYIWVDPRKPIVSDACLSDLVAFIDKSQSDPSFVGQYRVVRGSGKFYATGSFNGN